MGNLIVRMIPLQMMSGLRRPHDVRYSPYSRKMQIYDTLSWLDLRQFNLVGWGVFFTEAPDLILNIICYTNYICKHK